MTQNESALFATFLSENPEVKVLVEAQVARERQHLDDEVKNRLDARTIELGYVYLSSWKSTDGIWQDWMEHDKKYKKDIRAYKADDKVLPVGTYTLIIDYPLRHAYRKPFTIKKPMTRRDIIKLIVKSYRYIYKEEKRTSEIEVGYLPNTYNRNTTNGRFGVWGHVLGDLLLNRVYVNDAYEITLSVDS